MLYLHTLIRVLDRLVLVGLLSIVLGWTAARAQAPTFHFDIPGTTLSQALREFGRVSGQEIIFTEDLVTGVPSVPLRGDFTAESALERLLKGTGLVPERSASGAMMIRRQIKAPAKHDTSPPATTRAAPGNSPITIAQTTSGANTTASSGQTQAA